MIIENIKARRSIFFRKLMSLLIQFMMLSLSLYFIIWAKRDEEINEI